MSRATVDKFGRWAWDGPLEQGFSAFVEELYLTYLRRHCAWGGPARISHEVWAWRPDPCPARIGAAAAQVFKEQVEAAACAIPFERKRGGMTYAAEVRRLYDALAAVLASEAHAPADFGPCSTFALARIEGIWEIGSVKSNIDAPDLATAMEPPAVQSMPARQINRREALGFATLVPGALLGRSRLATAASGEPTIAVAVPDPVARVAGMLRDLEGLPWRDRYPLRRVPGRDAWEYYLPDTDADARLRELGIGPFTTAGALVRRLAGTLTVADDRFVREACAREDIAQADRADHIRYHAATADQLIARLQRYAATGTHWAGFHAGTGWTWNALVSCACFDLLNFAKSLEQREACVREAGDPLTFPAELQLALDPFLFRRCGFGSALIRPTLCAWLAPHAGKQIPASTGLTYVSLVDEGPGSPS
ncbi:hypothetical protein ASG60_20620 [Methylobacterium sp. Leaf469]|uniref:hypothetical protein n=1 Tax=Methylobacterium sp. Leaf469 TaxID=1736387 RepID=UPI0006F9D80E|nr:hypothetical protein [Methylobacterium sp. Leaf469]KQT96087.1 hypothetical protein ASG60_20620 [Methylobacterium sp. Leaf469]